MKLNFKNWLQWLNPALTVGGLEITDAAVRLVVLDNSGKVIRQEKAPLPAGTIEDGKLIAANQFLSSLQTIKPLPVIVSLSSHYVYTQVFQLPYLEGERLEEAAQLNLKTISPLDIKNSYLDWQTLGSTASGGLEVLGSFVQSEIVDALTNSLRQAGFIVVAVEFYGLSLARAISNLSGIDPNKLYLALGVTGDGLNFSVLKSGQLHFNYFTSWQAIQGKSSAGQVSAEDFQKVIVAELRRIINFSSARWGGTIGDLLLVSISPPKAISSVIKKELNLNIQEVSDPEWLAAIGVAQRGLLPRAEDRLISLTKVGTEEEFVRSRIRRFVNLWRNVALTALGIFLLIYLGADLYLIRVNRGLAAQLKKAGNLVNREEIILLENQAKSFNALIEKVVAARNRTSAASPFLRKLYLMTGPDVTLTQARLDNQSRLISLVGTAKNERAAIAFKNSLGKDPEVTNLSFPLSAITVGSDGRATFSATFTWKKSN